MEENMKLALSMETHYDSIEIELTEIKQEQFDREDASVEQECVICGKVLENQDFLSHMVMHAEEKPHKCLGCEKAFRKESSLFSHMKNYHGTDKFFPCQHCPRVFKCNSDLIRHTLIHTGEKPFNCSHCNKPFNQKGNLKIHESTCIKPNEPDKPRFDAPKQCQVCQKVLASSQTLSQHMLIHTNEKPHECLHCHKRFRIKKTLAKHVMAIHTPKENWKLYPGAKECPICKKMFKSGSDLKRHNLVHTGEKPFECSHCGYQRFGQKSSLTQHLLICPSIKEPSTSSAKSSVPSKCPTCKKVFTSTHKLDRHVLVHTGERPHQCSICGARFRLKHHLVGHEQKVHQQLPTKDQEASTSSEELELQPPSSIAKLFQRCSVVLERMAFIDDVAAKLRVRD